MNQERLAEIIRALPFRKASDIAIEIDRLRSIEAAARDLDRYEDWGSDEFCPECIPDEPADWIAARFRLAELLRLSS